MCVHSEGKVFPVGVSLHREVLFSAFPHQPQRHLLRRGRPDAELTLIVFRPCSQHLSGFANQGSFHVC
jgi:hypothetical protein